MFPRQTKQMAMDFISGFFVRSRGCAAQVRWDGKMGAAIIQSDCWPRAGLHRRATSSKGCGRRHRRGARRFHRHVGRVGDQSVRHRTCKFCRQLVRGERRLRCARRDIAADVKERSRCERHNNGQRPVHRYFRFHDVTLYVRRRVLAAHDASRPDPLRLNEIVEVRAIRKNPRNQNTVLPRVEQLSGERHRRRHVNEQTEYLQTHTDAGSGRAENQIDFPSGPYRCRFR